MNRSDLFSCQEHSNEHTMSLVRQFWVFGLAIGVDDLLEAGGQNSKGSRHLCSTCFWHGRSPYICLPACTAKNVAFRDTLIDMGTGGGRSGGFCGLSDLWPEPVCTKNTGLVNSLNRRKETPDKYGFIQNCQNCNKTVPMCYKRLFSRFYAS